MDSTEQTNTNDSITEEGIDFSKLNYPFRKKKNKRNIKSLGRNLSQDSNGNFIKICRKCKNEFTVKNRNNPRETCEDCSLKHIKICKNCGAQFVSPYIIASYCSKPDCVKLKSFGAQQIRSLIKIFAKTYGFRSQPEALAIAFRFYLMNREEAEKMREEYRKQKLEDQQQKKVSLEAIKLMNAKGMSLKEIAKELNSSPSTIFKRLNIIKGTKTDNGISN